LAKHCSDEEFEAVFSQYRNMVFKTAYLILADAQKAEDVLQEVFIKVHQSLGTFDSQKGKLSTWLYRITVNQCISERRTRHLPSVSLENLRQEGFDVAAADCQHPDNLALRQEESEKMQQAMKALDQKHRAVLVLRYFDDLSYEEVAQALDIPLGTVKSRLNTAIRTLRAELMEGRNTP
jgi:RNA polymerase sigma-70 factor, ECF subfamily